MRPRFLQPVTIDRLYLVLGYLLYCALGTTIAIYGSPSMQITTGTTYTRRFGWVIVVLALTSAVCATTDRLYKPECITVIVHACLMATYSLAAVVTSFHPTGSVDPDRATFSVVAFIITALLWARGLTLMRRWIYEFASRKLPA